MNNQEPISKAKANEIRHRSREEVVAVQEIRLAFEQMRNANKEYAEAKAIMANYHNRMQVVKESLDVAKQLRYGGKTWIREALAGPTYSSVCYATDGKFEEDLAQLIRISEGDLGQ